MPGIPAMGGFSLPDRQLMVINTSPAAEAGPTEEDHETLESPLG